MKTELGEVTVKNGVAHIDYNIPNTHYNNLKVYAVLTENGKVISEAYKPIIVKESVTILSESIQCEPDDTVILKAWVFDKYSNPVNHGFVQFMIGDKIIGVKLPVIDGYVEYSYELPWGIKTTQFRVYYIENDIYLGTYSSPQTLKIITGVIVKVDKVVGMRGKTVPLTAHIIDKYDKLVDKGTVIFEIID